MQPRAVCQQLAFLAQRSLDAFERRSGCSDDTRRKLVALRRSGARVEYWLLTYARVPSEWSSGLHDHAPDDGTDDVVAESKLRVNVKVSLHAWLYDRLRGEESFPHSLSRFTLRFLRERMNEDLQVYVDRHGRSVAPGALVFFEEHAWDVVRVTKRGFAFKRRGSNVPYNIVDADDMARHGTKLSDVGADVVRPAQMEALRRGDADFMSGYYLRGRLLRSEAERLHAASHRASVAAADAKPQSVGARVETDVQEHVSAAVNLLLAKRAAKSNLTTGTIKRSRFAVLR